MSSSRAVQRGRLRIIGGQWKKRLIRFNGAADLRPTPDSVRETLFNWLTPCVFNAECLDLFAGSGALGFEAASRGARAVTLIEMRQPCYTQLKETMSLLAADQVTTHCAEALEWMTSCTQQFDIVFVDPPYGVGLVERSLRRLTRYELLKPQARIYVECSVNETTVIPEGWVALRQKHAGQVSYSLYTNAPNAVDAPGIDGLS
jgi:16S rRNA (guanine966-N2)-methyltransferase